MNERFLEVSYRDLRYDWSSKFLWDCFKRFYHLVPMMKMDDNLIMIWKSDFDKLVKESNERNKSETKTT